MKQLLLKLHQSNDKLQNITVTGKESEEAFFDLLHFDFIEHILNHPVAGNHFKKRYSYFELLSEDNDYQGIERQTIGSLSSLCKKLSEIYTKNSLKGAKKVKAYNHFEKEKTFGCEMFLLELCAIASNPSSYSKLSELSSQTNGGLKSWHNLEGYMGQFLCAFECIRRLSYLIRKASKTLLVAEVKTCQTEALKLIQALESRLVEKPKRLHYRAYEDLGTEYVEMVQSNLLDQKRYKGYRIHLPIKNYIERLKKSAKIVLEDIEVLPLEGLPFFFDEKNFFHWLGKKSQLSKNTTKYFKELINAPNNKVINGSAHWRSTLRRNAGTEVGKKMGIDISVFEEHFRCSQKEHSIKIV